MVARRDVRRRRCSRAPDGDDRPRSSARSRCWRGRSRAAVHERSVLADADATSATRRGTTDRSVTDHQSSLDVAGWGLRRRWKLALALMPSLGPRAKNSPLTLTRESTKRAHWHASAPHVGPAEGEPRDDRHRLHHRSARARGHRRPRLRPLPRGVRGWRRLQALAGQDRDRVRRPPVLPHHDEPPPAAPQRRVRGRQPAGPQRRRRPAGLQPRAGHERLATSAARRSPTSPPRSSATRPRSSTATRCSWSPRSWRSASPRPSSTAAPSRSTRASSTRTARSSPSSSGSCWSRARPRASRRSAHRLHPAVAAANRRHPRPTAWTIRLRPGRSFSPGGALPALEGVPFLDAHRGGPLSPFRPPA